MPHFEVVRSDNRPATGLATRPNIAPTASTRARFVVASPGDAEMCSILKARVTATGVVAARKTPKLTANRPRM
jgi:hypothetical protein